MLAVGKELLIGRTMNSNALWVGKRLALLGSMLKEITTVDDDLGEIGDALKGALKRSPDFLIVVGGLGPTPDDMTLRGIGDGLGLSLRRNGEALGLIKAHYAKRGMANVELTSARLKMSKLPSGAIPLRNEAGTAPGVRLRVRETVVFCLPGVPAEMRSIFRGSVEPEVRSKIGKVRRSYLKMKLEGVLESSLAPTLAKELKRHPEAYIKSHPRGVKDGIPRIELDIAVVGTDRERVDADSKGIAREMSDAVAGMGGRAAVAMGPKGGDD